MVWGFMGAQKKTIAYPVCLELNLGLFGFEFVLLRAAQFGFWVAWHSERKKCFRVELKTAVTH